MNIRILPNYSLANRSKDTLKAEAYHKNASYFLLGELRIFI